MPFKFNPITNKLDLVENGTGPAPEQDFVTDAGTATSVAQVINVVGGTGISTTGVGDTVTINSTASAPAMVLLHTITFNNTASSYDITPYVTGYSTYKFIGSALASCTGVNPIIGLQFSIDGGTTWITTGYISWYQFFGSTGSFGSALTDNIPICFLNQPGTALNSCEAMMTGYGGSSGAAVQSSFVANSLSLAYPQVSGGQYSGVVLNGVRIINTAGTNYISGKFSIYGIAT